LSASAAPASAPPRWLPVAARAAAGLVAALGRTWRIEHPAGYAALDARIVAGERCIYAFWHGRLFPLVYSHRRRGIAVLISRHRDGEWIARVIEALGFRTARGSSTRGGGTGALEMLALAERGALLAITPDGPRGPARQVKPGLVWLAARTGWPVVPVATAASRAWVFRSWDRFRVPQPFARVQIAYGEPIHVRLDEAGEEDWRRRIEAAIDALTRTADGAVGAAELAP
jgi:lysophospholipid acyltransferase (LPLAT)-like uncharacterized protein